MKPTIWRQKIIDTTTAIAGGDMSQTTRDTLLNKDLLSTFLVSSTTRVRNIQRKQGTVLIKALQEYESSKSARPQKADIQQLALLFLQTMELGPAEKKEWSSKYFICTCKKQSEISAGLNGWIPMNVLALTSTLILIAILLAASPGLFVNLPLESLMILGIALITPSLTILEYRNNMKQMRKIGHSQACAQHIARTYILRSGRRTSLHSLDDEDAEAIMKLAVNNQKAELIQHTSKHP